MSRVSKLEDRVAFLENHADHATADRNHLDERIHALESLPVDEARDELKKRGWHRARTCVVDPQRSIYWQRWEGPSPSDWVELPSHMPPETVLATIRDMPARGLAVTPDFHP